MKACIKVTRKGQVTIPSEVRKALGIEEGSYVTFELRGDEVVLRKVPALEPGEPIGEEEYEKLIAELERLRLTWR